jgi:AcrR family transcriptional regulator
VSSSSPARRPYLRVDQRRRQLLDAAARIAGREGLDRLTMLGAAKEAGVSRQLVYEHFPDLPTLVRALVYDRFSQLDENIRGVLEGGKRDGQSAAVTGARLLLSLPTEERHIIRALLGHAGQPQHELSELAAALRVRMINRWSIALGTGRDRRSRSLIWALLHAVFGLGDSIDMGETSLDRALDQFAVLLAAAFPQPI